MENFSVSDIMALTQGEQQNEWLFFLLFFVLFGGGDFMNRAKAAPQTVDNSTILSAVQGNREAIASIQYATGVNQSELIGGLSRLGEAVNSVALRGDNNTDRVVSAITAGSVEILTQLAACCCDTQKSILETKYELGTKIDASTYALSDRINGAYNALTNQITQQGFAMEKGFSGVEQMFLQQKLDMTRDRLLQTESALNNANQTAAIVAAIQNPVVSVPTYPYIVGGPYASAHTGGVNINKASNRADYDVRG